MVQLASLNWLTDISPKLHKHFQHKSMPLFWITGSIFRVTGSLLHENSQ